MPCLLPSPHSLRFARFFRYDVVKGVALPIFIGMFIGFIALGKVLLLFINLFTYYK